MIAESLWDLVVFCIFLVLLKGVVKKTPVLSKSAAKVHKVFVFGEMKIYYVGYQCLINWFYRDRFLSSARNLLFLAEKVLPLATMPTASQ